MRDPKNNEPPLLARLLNHVSYFGFSRWKNTSSLRTSSCLSLSCSLKPPRASTALPSAQARARSKEALINSKPISRDLITLSLLVLSCIEPFIGRLSRPFLCARRFLIRLRHQYSRLDATKSTTRSSSCKVEKGSVSHFYLQRLA